MKLEEAQLYEEELRNKLEHKNPKHPALKKIYHSTWQAIDEYQKALMEG